MPRPKNPKRPRAPEPEAVPAPSAPSIRGYVDPGAARARPAIETGPTSGNEQLRRSWQIQAPDADLADDYCGWRSRGRGVGATGQRNGARDEQGRPTRPRRDVMNKARSGRP